MVAATAAAAALSPAARASYTVYGCALPSGAPAPVDGWTFSATSGAIAQSQCDPSKYNLHALALMFGGLAVPVGSQAKAVFTAPSATAIVGATLFRFFAANPGPGEQSVSVAVDNVAVDGCAPVSCTTRGSLSEAWLSFANRVDLPFTSGQRLAIEARCDAPSFAPTVAQCPDSSPGPSGAFIFGSRVLLADVAAPGFVGVPHGSLLESRIGGVRSATVDVVDAGGGVAKTLLLADGRVVGQQSVNPTGSCRPPYVRTVPCPLSAHVTMSYDTRSLADGPHRLSVAVEDAGGNRTVSGSFAVTVANGRAPNGVHASRAARLAGRLLDGRTVAYGGRARLRGRLVDSAGAPIGSARLEVVERTRLAGAAWHSAGATVTDSAGRFAVRLASGPSRDVRVLYRAYASDPAPAAQFEARVLVRAGVRLRVSPARVQPNGRIRFTGSLAGGPGRAGLLVTLYVSAGRRIPVAVLRTDRLGRFRFAYRFQRTFQPTTFPFWAQVEAQHGYPYVRGRSRRVLVRVL